MGSFAYLCRALSTALTFLTDYYHALSSLGKAIDLPAFKQETNVYLLIKIFYLSRIISACLCSTLIFFFSSKTSFKDFETRNVSNSIFMQVPKGSEKYIPTAKQCFLLSFTTMTISKACFN